MAQEFTINSKTIEDKINTLLPSQGGFGAGIDFSASTMVIPIVDLTESAEGSSLRQDLQLAFSHNSNTSVVVSNATNTTIINTTGYFRIFGNYYGEGGAVTTNVDNINLFDGSTSKNVWAAQIGNGINDIIFQSFDFIVFLAAGDSVRATTNASAQRLHITSRQVADITGTLVNPL
tara:strand:+ start:384 stop:911 length:528 start_codon:yes stop_codon:yes gene_type:complete